MKKILFILFLLSVMLSCNSDDDVVINDGEIITPLNELILDENEEFAGGETTVFDTSGSAFEFSARNIPNSDLTSFVVGNSLFEQNWVTAPASTTARDGLGPFFNSRSCSGCHGRDGRGRAPDFAGEVGHGLLLRLNINEQNEFGSYLGDPIYGGQLQDQSILGVDTEGGFQVDYSEQRIEYPDGTFASLRVPTYIFNDLLYGDLDPNVRVSPRVANQMIGLGLLEAISEDELLASEDADDEDTDGISGRLNRVYDVENDRTVIGRFGWKANQPSLRQQVAGAFIGDLGITSSIFSNENCTEGIDCNSIPNGGDNELDDDALKDVVFYSSTLAVPARRNFDTQETLQGKQLFEDARCTSCHTPKFTTGNHAISALENQVIFPYTDLLLHDMGEALADNSPDFEASGSEWRTPPLWGIGLINSVNRHTDLLHDGRARNVEEAILWHGGEAENSKLAFMQFSVEERQKVIDFINTL